MLAFCQRTIVCWGVGKKGEIWEQELKENKIIKGGSNLLNEKRRKRKPRKLTKMCNRRKNSINSAFICSIYTFIVRVKWAFIIYDGKA